MARSTHKFHYIYKITCLKNNRYYIGMHSTNNLEDGYMGGGKDITNSIRYYGKKNHKKEILEYLNDRDSLAAREKEIINEDLLNDPMCMNLMIGGYGGGGIHNQDHLKKFCEAGNEEFKKRLQDPDYKESFSNMMRDVVKKNPRGWGLDRSKRGKGFTKNCRHKEESKRKMTEAQKGDKNSQYGRYWVFHKEFGSKRIDEVDLQNHLNLGWARGRKEKESKDRCWIFHEIFKPKKIERKYLGNYKELGWCERKEFLKLELKS
jgi:hypothetical protein